MGGMEAGSGEGTACSRLLKTAAQLDCSAVGQPELLGMRGGRRRAGGVAGRGLAGSVAGGSPAALAQPAAAAHAQLPARGAAAASRSWAAAAAHGARSGERQQPAAVPSHPLPFAPTPPWLRPLAHAAHANPAPCPPRCLCAAGWWCASPTAPWCARWRTPPWPATRSSARRTGAPPPPAPARTPAFPPAAHTSAVHAKLPAAACRCRTAAALRCPPLFAAAAPYACVVWCAAGAASAPALARRGLGGGR